MGWRSENFKMLRGKSEMATMHLPSFALTTSFSLLYHKALYLNFIAWESFDICMPKIDDLIILFFRLIFWPSLCWKKIVTSHTQFCNQYTKNHVTYPKFHLNINTEDINVDCMKHVNDRIMEWFTYSSDLYSVYMSS